jgi:hypothetical protein
MPLSTSRRHRATALRVGSRADQSNDHVIIGRDRYISFKEDGFL